MITKERIEEFQEFYSEIAEAANEILAELNAVKKIDGFKFLSFSHIDDDSVTFTGTETWRYGGREDYEYDLRLELLYDKEALESYKANLRKQIKAAKAREAKEKSRLVAARKQQYEKLKEEFEGQ